jgi:hypothetical protein
MLPAVCGGSSPHNAIDGGHATMAPYQPGWIARRRRIDEVACGNEPERGRRPWRAALPRSGHPPRGAIPWSVSAAHGGAEVVADPGQADQIWSAAANKGEDDDQENTKALACDFGAGHAGGRRVRRKHHTGNDKLSGRHRRADAGQQGAGQRCGGDIANNRSRRHGHKRRPWCKRQGGRRSTWNGEWRDDYRQQR